MCSNKRGKKKNINSCAVYWSTKTENISEDKKRITDIHSDNIVAQGASS